MKKRKVLSLLLSGVMAFSQPLATIQASDILDIADDVEAEQVSIKKELDTMAVFSNGTVADVYISDITDFPSGYSIEVNELDSNTKALKTDNLKEIRGKGLDVALGFEIKCFDDNKNQILLSDNNIVKFYIEDTSQVSGTTLYHEKQDGSWESLSYNIMTDSKGDYLQFSGHDFGTFLFGSNVKEEDLTIDNSANVDLPDLSVKDNANEIEKDEEDLTVNDRTEGVSDSNVNGNADGNGNEVNNTNGKKTFSWSDIIGEQVVNIDVSSEKEFPDTDYLSVTSNDESEIASLEASLKKSISKDGKILSLDLKICGEDGIEDSMDEEYNINVNISNPDALKNAKLYQEQLNGTWQEIEYKEETSDMRFSSTGLGFFVFVTEGDNDDKSNPGDIEGSDIVDNNDGDNISGDADAIGSEDSNVDDITVNPTDIPDEEPTEMPEDKDYDESEIPEDTSDDTKTNNDLLPTEAITPTIELEGEKENNKEDNKENDSGNIDGENVNDDANGINSDNGDEDKLSVFTYEDEDVVITAEVKSEAEIPETAILQASKLDEGSDAYNTAMDEVKSSVNLKDGQKLLFIPYDVYFKNAVEKIEPADGKVQVSMAFKDSLFGTSPSSSETFAAHIKNDGVVEHIENTAEEKDTVSFTVSSFSIMGPAMVTNSDIATHDAVTPIIIDRFSASFASGASYVNGKYVWNPTDPAPGHIFMYRVDYTMSGVFSTDRGAFKIVLPLHILKDRDGNWADTFDCPYQLESEIADTENPDFVYSIDEENNTATIYNYAPYPSGEAGYIEFYYATDRSTLYYPDMGGSTTVHAKVYATNENSTVTEEADADPVYIDTHATISYTQKKIPYLYRTWNSSWGEKPADADDYLYLVWTIRTYINKNTSIYDFYLDDTFTDLGGSVVGYKFAGQTQFSETNHIDNVTLYGDRYDYVLTRHSKAEAEAAMAASANIDYKVHNSIIAKVSPIDHVDPDTTAKASQEWWYEEPRYSAPTGHFWSEKYGLYGGYHIVDSSEDITDYTLQEFSVGDENAINHVRYYVYGNSYPYPWTLGDGADGTINDVKNGLYGQKKVDYEFYDDIFYVEGQKLNDNDYDLASVRWTPTIRTATFDENSYTFTEAPIVSYKDEDKITVLVRIGSEWKEAAVYNPQTKKYENINEAYIKSAAGEDISFTAGVKGIKFTGSNGYYHTRFDVYPDITLNRTSNLIDIIGTATKIRVTNEANFSVKQNDKTIFQRTTKATDYIQRVIRESEIKKDVIQTKNMKRENRFDVTWRVNVQEKYTDNTGIHYIFQESGKFYDLLPAGSILNTSTISVTASGADLASGEYTYEVIGNFKDSGRAMLVITITEPTKDRYYLTYQTSHPYESINDYGKNLLNSVAYESGNEKIGEGLPDNGGNITDKTIMSDLDSDTDGDKFLYAEARYNINVPVAAATGLKKQVKNSTDKQYSYKTTAHLNEDYSYQVRLTNDAFTKSKDIVFFDSLENFYQKATESIPTIPSDWKGTLTGINTNNMIFKGIKPVIYLSKVDTMNIQKHHDLSETLNGEAVWLKYDEFVKKYGLDNATAIAVDASKCTDGSDYIMVEKESVSFDIYMKAPSSDESGKQDPIAYNNIYVNRTALREDGDEVYEIPQFYHQDYTQVHYRVSGDLNLKKVDATDGETPIKGITYKLSGTSDYGTEYSEERVSTKNGDMLFETVEKGTYELREIKCSDDWQLNTETYVVTIDGTGNAVIENLPKSGNAYVVSDEPRIHTDIVFLKYNNVTGGMVKGAKFRLSGTSDYGNEYLMYAESNEIGRVDFENVELGTYELAEIEAPKGYIQKKDPWKVKVDEKGAAIIYDGDTEEQTNTAGYYTLINEPYHSIRFVKSSTYGDNIYLEGAEFSLTGVSDYGTSVDMTAVSGKAEDGGLVVFDGLEPGTYVLKETKAPAEHDLDENPHTVVVNKDGTFTIEGLGKTKFGKSVSQNAADASNDGENSLLVNVDENLSEKTSILDEITK